MVVTEEAAAGKWCPAARIGNEAGCNRNGADFPAKPTCIGSRCMAWQWAQRLGNSFSTKPEHATEITARHPDAYETKPDALYPALVTVTVVKGLGGCGLAGDWSAS